jgi:predicted metal-dependent enzyme (double-stranded beta helix superfamily)
MQAMLTDVVDRMRTAAAGDDPSDAVREALRRCLGDASGLARLIARQAEDEEHLFEDAAVSVWTCRFHAGVLMPPHEHRMPVHIAVVGGAERNILYRRRDGALERAAEKNVHAGEILSLGPEAVHAVTALGPEPSLALHVYLGPLMRIERSLFDWDTGEAVPFTMENFSAMQRPV